MYNGVDYPRPDRDERPNPLDTECYRPWKPGKALLRTKLSRG
jgi:hypothetical protein